MALTQEQIDAFLRDGYLKFGRLFEPEELETLRREYDREFVLAEKGGHWRNLSASDGAPIAEQKAAKVQMIQIMQMCERNLHFRKLLYDPRILDVVEDLIGPNIMLFHDQAFLKPAFHGGEVTWHQDNSYWHCHPANLVSCWIALDDADEANGAMQVVPGSHLQPMLHSKRNEKDILFDLKDQIDMAKVVTVDVPAGACMFHHCQTVHHTNPNTTARQRRAFAIHYMAVGTTRGKDRAPMRASYSQPVLRLRM